MSNSVLNYTANQVSDGEADATATLTKSALDDVQLGLSTLPQKVEAGEITFEGDSTALPESIGMLDSFDLRFNVVTP